MEINSSTRAISTHDPGVGGCIDKFMRLIARLHRELLASKFARNFVVVAAMRVALSTAALAFGDVGRMMFDPTAVYAPQTSAGAVAAVVDGAARRGRHPRAAGQRGQREERGRAHTTTVRRGASPLWARNLPVDLFPLDSEICLLRLLRPSSSFVTAGAQPTRAPRARRTLTCSYLHRSPRAYSTHPGGSHTPVRHARGSPHAPKSRRRRPPSPHFTSARGPQIVQHAGPSRRGGYMT